MAVPARAVALLVAAAGAAALATAALRAPADPGCRPAERHLAQVQADEAARERSGLGFEPLTDELDRARARVERECE